MPKAEYPANSPEEDSGSASSASLYPKSTLEFEGSRFAGFVEIYSDTDSEICGFEPPPFISEKPRGVLAQIAELWKALLRRLGFVKSSDSINGYTVYPARASALKRSWRRILGRKLEYSIQLWGPCEPLLATIEDDSVHLENHMYSAVEQLTDTLIDAPVQMTKHMGDSRVFELQRLEHTYMSGVQHGPY